MIIILALGAGLLATILTANHVRTSIEAETQRLAQQFERQQAKRDQEFQQQLGILNQQLNQLKVQQAELAKRPVAAPQTAAAPTEEAAVKPSLALRTPPGKRAITIQIDSLAAVGGLINPGDFVDVIGHLDVPKGKAAKKDSITAMMFQNLQILAVNTNLDQPGAYDVQQKERTLKVTVAVDPKEAGLLSFSDKNGKLEMVLRSPREKRHHMLQASTWKTLAEYVMENHGADIGIEEEKKAEPAVPAAREEVEEVEAEEARPYIQIFRGGREL
jgi:Flp pilus assembly protein CpaB